MISNDIHARCPECGNWVHWLMDRPPSRRVVEKEPISVKPDGLTLHFRWRKHPCNVGNLYQRDRQYRWDLWGYGHEIREEEWLP